jgi:hypothetical protein
VQHIRSSIRRINGFATNINTKYAIHTAIPTEHCTFDGKNPKHECIISQHQISNISDTITESEQIDNKPNKKHTE